MSPERTFFVELFAENTVYARADLVEIQPESLIAFCGLQAPYEFRIDGVRRPLFDQWGASFLFMAIERFAPIRARRA
jgi:hypothetical protein